MRFIRISLPFIVAGVCMVFFNSCNSCNRQQTVKDITIDISELADSSQIDIAKNVFYSLPTPIEISILIKNMGIEYRASLLNDPANADKYMTNRKMAINFGIYITDLTYAGLFEQTQTVLRYKTSIQKLTEGLGMQSAINNNLLKQLEANIYNREDMLRIISDTYASCTAYLDENDRYFVTVAILTGGWIEGMYIATSLTDENLVTTLNRVEQLVVDQKLTFDMIWQVMSEMKDYADINALINEMSGLAKAFDQVMVDHTANKVSSGEDGVSILKSSVTSNVTPDIYIEIKRQIQNIRHNFIKK